MQRSRDLNKNTSISICVCVCVCVCVSFPSSLPVELWYYLMLPVMWFIGGYSCFTRILAWTGLFPHRAADHVTRVTWTALSSNWPCSGASPWRMWVHVFVSPALCSKEGGMCYKCSFAFSGKRAVSLRYAGGRGHLDIGVLWWWSTMQGAAGNVKPRVGSPQGLPFSWFILFLSSLFTS